MCWLFIYWLYVCYNRDSHAATRVRNWQDKLCHLNTRSQHSLCAHVLLCFSPALLVFITIFAEWICITGNARLSMWKASPMKPPQTSRECACGFQQSCHLTRKCHSALFHTAGAEWHLAYVTSSWKPPLPVFFLGIEWSFPSLFDNWSLYW
jgi:hypothetical protein